MESEEKSTLFKGMAQTVKTKKIFLEEYPKQGYRMKQTAMILGLAYGTVTQWYLHDSVFKQEYLKLKEHKKELKRKTMLGPLSEAEIPEAKQKILQVYEKQSDPIMKCCDQLNMSRSLVREWLADDPEFRKSYQGLSAKKRGLSKISADRWKEIAINAQEKHIEARIKRQETFIKTYLNTTFNITEACKAANIIRPTFKMWLKKYPEFQEKFEEAFETKKDFIESKLLENIKANDSACIIHASKTILRERGYGEKQEIEISGKFGVMVVPGTIESASAWATKATVQQKMLKNTVSANGTA